MDEVESIFKKGPGTWQGLTTADPQPTFELAGLLRGPEMGSLVFDKSKAAIYLLFSFSGGRSRPLGEVSSK